MTDGNGNGERNKRIEHLLKEQNDSLSVLRKEAIEMRGVMKRLVTVLNDLHLSIHSVLVELQHLRTERARAEHLTDFAKAATNEGGSNG